MGLKRFAASNSPKFERQVPSQQQQYELSSANRPRNVFSTPLALMLEEIPLSDVGNNVGRQ